MKSYRCVEGAYRTELTVRKSRFIATASECSGAEDAAEFIKRVKKEFPDARHTAYAYIADEYGVETGYSDDGEPSSTAGLPILNVISKRDLKRTVVAVTRYFGGIKLGTGGLVSAYTDAAVAVLDRAKLKVRTQCVRVSVKAGYSCHSALEAYLKGLEVKEYSAEFSDRVSVSFYVPEDDLKTALDKINELSNGAAEIEFNETAFR